MKLKAVRDTVIVKIEYSETMRGIIVPEKAKQYSGNMCGIVVAIGPDYKADLKVGEKVFYRRHEGHRIIVGQDEYISLREKWVVAKEVKNG